MTTLVNTLYSLLVGLLFGLFLYALAFAFPMSRPIMVACWRLSPVGTVLGCLCIGLLATALFIIGGWWILGFWFLLTLLTHVSAELKGKKTKVKVEIS